MINFYFPLKGLDFMKIIRNEKGITLLEILITIAILSIVLTSFMSLFPQMGLMNKHNEDKAQAVNTAKQLLNKWTTDQQVIGALKNPNPLPTDWPSSYIAQVDNYYLFESENPKAKIIIFKQPETGFTGTDPIKAYQIHILILNNRDNVISKTYGYVVVK
jgi:prepilin-type N-terminal cleavage/methylation domain-containing protein